jgi:N-acetylmuramoyl-L-alanine amidase
MSTPNESLAVDTVARTIFGEARGEGPQGMQAVASVILNRAKRPCWWGRDITGVCRAPFQFSAWLVSDPNRPKLLAVTDADPFFRCALAIADLAVAGALPDNTNGADSYYAVSMGPPRWCAGLTPTAVIGRQRFYRVAPR